MQVVSPLPPLRPTWQNGCHRTQPDTKASDALSSFSGTGHDQAEAVQSTSEMRMEHETHKRLGGRT